MVAIASAQTPWCACGQRARSRKFPPSSSGGPLGVPAPAAAGDGELHVPRDDRCGSKADSGQAGPACPVERCAADNRLEPCVKGGQARMKAAMEDRTPQDIIDVGRDKLVTLCQRAEHRGCDVLRVHVRQRTLADLADSTWRPACIDDQGVSH
jgi:hypothetical protein